MTNQGQNLEKALEQFGLNSFRPGQREVIEAIVAGHDCVCIMPTGGGKSLCYQLPSLIRPGLTIVVSPLIALMKDQVDSLDRNGIPAALINSTLSQSEQQQRLQNVASGRVQLLYVAPERLRNSRFLEAIRATPIQLLAIDEAHCISQWGHDFRPDYARIGKFREWLGGIQTVALTATATPRVRDDIVNVLGIKRPKQFMSGFARPNLHFGVVQQASDREKDSELEGFLVRHEGSGIIYAATRKRCDALVEMISSKLRIPVGAYHAGLLPDQRRAVQERFMKNELRIIVATNAFGMGIDKPDLRFVIHYNMPGSLEAYYQEAGRAGRDGLQSQCVMLYSFQDRYIQEFFIDNNYPTRETLEKVYNFLTTRTEDPIELTLEEIRDATGLNISPEAVGSAMQILSRTGAIDRLEMGGGLAMVKIDSNLPTLVDMLPREAKQKRHLLRVIERAVGDRRFEDVYLHPRWLLQESGLTREALSRTLRELCKLEAFDYVPPFRGRAIHFRKQGVPFSELEIDFPKLQKLKEAEYDRLNQVVNYAQSPMCRQATILRYFGDSSAENCGQCDRCTRSPGWPKFAVAGMTKITEVTSQLPAGVVPAAQFAKSPKKGGLTPEEKELCLGHVVDSIGRFHGRLGKHLISQFLCGSQNSKVQKLNLHRLSGFGMLKNFRQTDAVELLDALLAAGILRQQEVNRNRPTVVVAPEMVNASNRSDLLQSLELPNKLQTKLATLIPLLSPNARPTVTASSGQESVSHVSSTTADTTESDSPQLNAEKSTTPETVRKLPSSSTSPSVDIASQRRELGTSPSAPHIASGSKASESWTIRLFEQGFCWSEVCEIRRLDDAEVAEELCKLIKRGQTVASRWLAGLDGDSPTRGQQRVLHEASGLQLLQ